MNSRYCERNNIQNTRTIIFGLVIKRLEILESEVHDKEIQSDYLKKKKITRKIEQNLQTWNQNLKNDLKKNTNKVNESLNVLEQYGQRNNVGITRIENEDEKQSSMATSYSIV